jgi:hypothetical protein
MFKAINSFQWTAALALAPFGISWLSTASFESHNIARWVAIMLYGVMLIVNTVFVYMATDN